jgi:hypothetical protein
MSPERLCRYEPCACRPPPGHAYCDPSCEARDRPGGETLQEECLCGHPECRPEHAEEIGADTPS